MNCTDDVHRHRGRVHGVGGRLYLPGVPNGLTGGKDAAPASGSVLVDGTAMQMQLSVERLIPQLREQ